MGVLVPQRGIKPAPLVVEAKSLNPWATRDVLYFASVLGKFYLSVAVLGPHCVAWWFCSGGEQGLLFAVPGSSP